jgi:hypothetical protein
MLQIMNNLKIVYFPHLVERTDILKSIREYRKKNNEELVHDYNSKVKTGIVGARAQARELYALGLVMRECFGTSPIFEKEQGVLGLPGKVVLIDNEIYLMKDDIVSNLTFQGNSVYLPMPLCFPGTDISFSSESVLEVVKKCIDVFNRYEAISMDCELVTHNPNNGSSWSTYALKVDNRNTISSNVFRIKTHQLVQVLISRFNQSQITIYDNGNIYKVKKN